MPLRDCDPFMNAIRNNNAEMIKYIRENQCAFTPKSMYCCPKNSTDRISKTLVKLPKAKDGICGRSFDESLPSRIVGGEKAVLGEFPWLSMLIYSKRKVLFFKSLNSSSRNF